MRGVEIQAVYLGYLFIMLVICQLVVFKPLQVHKHQILCRPQVGKPTKWLPDAKRLRPRSDCAVILHSLIRAFAVC